MESRKNRGPTGNDRTNMMHIIISLKSIYIPLTKCQAFQPLNVRLKCDSLQTHLTSSS